MSELVATAVNHINGARQLLVFFVTESREFTNPMLRSIERNLALAVLMLDEPSIALELEEMHALSSRDGVHARAQLELLP